MIMNVQFTAPEMLDNKEGRKRGPWISLARGNRKDLLSTLGAGVEGMEGSFSLLKKIHLPLALQMELIE